MNDPAGNSERDEEHCASRDGNNETLKKQPKRRHPALVLCLLMLVVTASSLGYVYREKMLDIVFSPVSTMDKKQSSSLSSSPAGVVVEENSSKSTLVRMEATDGRVYSVTEQAAEQINNYRKGKGLILNLHVTHHGGTTMCWAIGRSSSAPDFYCMLSEADVANYSLTTRFPWTRNETSTRIGEIRKHYHMIAMEFGNDPGRIPSPALSATDWENPNLLSILVMRDPISRLLAHNAWVAANLPDIYRGNASRDDWWKYAKDPWRTNNYALRVLGGSRGECCDGEKTDPKYLDRAKALVSRMSIVLDLQCLTQGIEAIGSLLNITLANPSHLYGTNRTHAPSRDRIGNNDIYDYLLQKNRLDIELYEWSKGLALVNCTAQG